MIYKNQPIDFNSQFEVVSCFLEYNGKILLLQRQDDKVGGSTWGVPAGKIENNENTIQAILREIKVSLLNIVAPNKW